MLELGVHDKSGIQDCIKAHPNDAAFDVRSADNVYIESGDHLMIHTGLYLDIPSGYEIQVRPRSGLAYKQGITVLNSPGTIDENYTGECNVILINHGKATFGVARGDRIAQFVLAEIPKYEIKFIDEGRINAKHSRGGGFGHSGVS